MRKKMGLKWGGVLKTAISKTCDSSFFAAVFLSQTRSHAVEDIYRFDWHRSKVRAFDVFL